MNLSHFQSYVPPRLLEFYFKRIKRQVWKGSYPSWEAAYVNAQKVHFKGFFFQKK